MQCKCGFVNPEEMCFCGKCGGKLEQPVATQPMEEVTEGAADVECPKCRAKMPRGAVFCGLCGHDLRGPASDAERATSVREDSTVEFPNAPPAPPAVDPSGSTEVNQAPCREDEIHLQSPQGAIREMVMIPAGWCAIGSPGEVGNDDEHPRHQVELDAYYIDRCAVSNIEYERFVPGHRRLRPEVAEGDNDPVVFVSYRDCLRYCRWRAEQEGVPPNTYSLPTEAQWERAARGGFHDRIYPWGNEIIPGACNTAEAGRERTVPVEEGIPNEFGLFHMGSNVREWCRDYYEESYYGSLEATGSNPAGPQTPSLGNMVVVRGASFQDVASELGRCAARNFAHPNNSSSDTGFRCVRFFG